MLARGFLKERISLPGLFRGRDRQTSIPEQLPAPGRTFGPASRDLRIALTAILADADYLSQFTLSDIERLRLYCEIYIVVDQMNEVACSLLEYSKDTDRLTSQARTFRETQLRAQFV